MRLTFQVGDKVEWKHHSSARRFKGYLVGWAFDKYYAWVSCPGSKPLLLNSERLRKPGQPKSMDDL